VKTNGQHLRHGHRGGPEGFTLLEVMLAVFIFGMAAVALVEAVNSSGRASLDARQKGNIQARLDNLLLETTRDPMWMENTRSPVKTEREFKEGPMSFSVLREPLELKNEEGVLVQGVYLVRVSARWMEMGRERTVTAETWVYPPLFRPSGVR
jgi:prepilin-type N-terminal cleavage/methylation domain-containing protein